MRSYEAARSTFSFLGFCAWVLIVLGGIAALMGLAALSEMSGYGRGPSALALFASALPGASIALAGFICLALVQMGRATVDTAEYTQQMLQLSRDQLEVSKQGLKAQNLASQSFAATVSPESPKSPKASFAGQAEKQPDPAPERQEQDALTTGDTDYRGKTITSANGNFLYNGIPFETLAAAKSYIDNFGTSADKKLTAPQRNS